MEGFFSWATFGIVCILAGYFAALGNKVEMIRRKVNAIAQHLGMDAGGTQVPPQVLGLIQVGRKIEAIKVYREATGASLSDAKRAVEAMET